MKGKLFYFAVASLLGLLSALEESILFFGLFVCIGILLKKFRNFTKAQLYLLLCAYFIFIGIGHLSQATNMTRLTGKEKDIAIYFDGDIKIEGGRLTATVNAIPAGEKIVVRHNIETWQEQELLKNRIKPGVACKITGTLDVPDEARNPNAFNYRTYLSRQGIFWIMKPDSLDPRMCRQQHANLLTRLKRVRHEGIQYVVKNFPPETAAASSALLFGDQTLIDPGTYEAYKKTGTVHILSISGLHVALLSGMIYAVCLRTGMTREKAETSLILFLPVYAVLTGLSPPVNRAVIMMMIYLCGKRFGFKIGPVDAVSLAFILLISVDAFAIYEPGLQLSFCVTFSLLVSTRGILPKFKSFLTKSAAISLIAQISSLPVLLFFFYEFSLISVIANAVFVPLFSAILPLVIVLLFLHLASSQLADPLLNLATELISASNRLSEIIAAFPMSDFTVGKPGIFLMLLYVCAIPASFLMWEKRKLLALFIPLFPLLLQCMIPYINPYGKIVFIDIGQGDSIYIQLPYNRGNYLVDTGGRIPFQTEQWKKQREDFEPGKDILVPYLKSIGIRNIDKLILTHGDMDHIGGAVGLLAEINAREIVLPAFVQPEGYERNILKFAQQRNIPVKFVSAGNRWKEGKTSFQIVSPMGRSQDKNDGSIVILANAGGKKWLFTGDLGFEGETRFIDEYGQLDIDVLKVGHHGSRSSSSDPFLKMVKPEIAVISAGEKNRYGHPHTEVLDRLSDFGVKTYRTDENGAVIYTFKGQDGTFSTQLP
ncbi:DNA internalization-related competence protein ComEC/Rec2 [Bacillus sp. T33-2]|uniref:DNA internalization-related competence protein ComEC/Rec2 n=1 Tax=Bacillus sp. T33-2 TaxID=2054168 RepID=UPI000C790F77|nr:DNA internalization-related competence protein ComEC/Rec2 [Bacillus sp. T33-2]PLR93799.1 DNA internalization-related competence protein ComEC/Rec2 [Bacillus sp. T33-2]